MILDYNYNSYSRRLDVSYISDTGAKQILSFNVNRFKAYYSTPKGQFTNWAGDKCDIRWVEKPSKFEIKTFLTELPESQKALLSQKTFPKVYSFDIEALKNPHTGEYSDATEASGAISVISITSPDLNTLVLGTLQMSEFEQKVLDSNFNEYVNNTKFFKTLKMKMPYVKYVQFANEEEMLKYFLMNIVAKVPILTGWNCIRYDWQYIVNRIKNYYPNLSIRMASCTRRTINKTYKDKYNNEFSLPMPEHTLIIDMMEVIEQHDKKVMPMKESMKLDYVADVSMGIHKIEYTKSLDDLYESDYGRYVFYNAIDSFIVQLINYRFKTLDSIYLIARYINEKISNCFGSIAITEALIFKDFYELGLKIVYEEQNPPRGKLVGAYVKKSVPGIHSYVCCNDFASLYPSTIRTCNLSFENYIGGFWLNEKLEPFKKDPKRYVVIGPNVFENEKTAKEPKAGRLLYTFLDEERLKQYRNPNYFVSVNGCVYKNDKDYSFKRIQSQLQVARDHDKYLGKDLDAQVLVDIHHILNGTLDERKQYADDVIEVLKGLGLDYTCTADLEKESRQRLEELENIISKEVVYFDNNQKAMKDIMNAMYGSASNVSFYWYNMNLANDITGEARNLIHKMEHHIPDWFRNNWVQSKELHKQLGIEVDEKQAEKALNEAILITPEQDPDAYNKQSFVLPVYGDSCDGNTIIATTRGNIKIKDLYDKAIIKKSDRDKEFGSSDYFIKNYDGKNEIVSPIKYVIRHKTNKTKWCIKTKYNNVIVTGDHSMIVIEDGKMVTIKPSDIKIGMFVYTLKHGIIPITDVSLIGNFENEYVYDIEVLTNDANRHNFFGNGILIHNTDSVDKDTLVHTENGSKTIEQFFNENNNGINLLTHKGHELVHTSEKILNWTQKDGLHYDNVNYIMRHKVSKPKWKLKTKNGKEVICTNDHSLIVFRDGKQLEVKPYEIKSGDKVLIIK